MEIDDFNVEVSYVAGCVVVVARGELDVVSGPILQSALDAQPPHVHVVIDCLGVSFIDSSSLQLIVSQALVRQQSGGSLRLRNCMFPVRQLIDLTGLIHLFEVDDGTGMPDMGIDADTICARPLL
ncbi:MAG: STAS domain-containing protein [Ilumatobacteraceae bacterium]